MKIQGFLKYGAMLNLQNVWFVLDLIILWKIVGVPDKLEYSLSDSPLHVYTLGHNATLQKEAGSYNKYK